MKKLQSIELFSGGGGLALGLHAAGFRHKALYEWNASAVETLLYNQRVGHPSLQGCTIHRADVREVDFTRHCGMGECPTTHSPQASPPPSLAA